MVTVPHVVPDVPALRRDPVVAYLPDLFRRPSPMRADVILDISDQMDTIAKMLACHRSQLFEWLAYHDGVLDTVPENESEKLAWVRAWVEPHILRRAERFLEDLVTRFGQVEGSATQFIEFFEISEYASQPDQQRLRELFPRSV